MFRSHFEARFGPRSRQVLTGFEKIVFVSSNSEDKSYFEQRIIQRGITQIECSLIDQIKLVAESRPSCAIIFRSEEWQNIDFQIDNAFIFDPISVEFETPDRHTTFGACGLFFSGGLTSAVDKLLKLKGIMQAPVFFNHNYKDMPNSILKLNVQQNILDWKGRLSTVVICDEDPDIARLSYGAAECYFEDCNIILLTDIGIHYSQTPIDNTSLFKGSLPKRWSGANSAALEKFVCCPIVQSEKQLTELITRLIYFL